MVPTTQDSSNAHRAVQTAATVLLALVALANFFRDPHALVPTLVLAVTMAVVLLHGWQVLSQRRFNRATAAHLQSLENKVAELRANSLPKSVYWLWPALEEQGWDFRLAGDTLTLTQEATGATVHAVISSLEMPQLGRLSYSRLVADLEQAGFRTPQIEPWALRLAASR